MIERWDDRFRGTENVNPRMNRYEKYREGPRPILARMAYLASYYKGRENRRLFDGIETYCMFIGYLTVGTV